MKSPEFQPAVDEAASSESVTLSARASSSGAEPPVAPAAPGTDNDPQGTKSHLQTPKSRNTVDVANEPTVIPRSLPLSLQPSLAGTDAKASDAETAHPAADDSLGGAETATVIGQLSPEESVGPTFIAGPADPTQKRYVPVVTDIGPYAIEGELGRGGMGVVYKAQHKKLRHEVALKMILKKDTDDNVLSRFELEAQSVAALKHPGIVQIYEYGTANGAPWFSLEFVDGKTLAQLAGGEPLEPRRAAKLVADLAAAVAYAHEKGVLHRDIKPANVLVTAGDVPKLTDFGLAKRATSEESAKEMAEHKTIDGQILGTPSFMPPEQARGDQTLIGPLSDQYSLGATLYCLLTGRAPFAGARPLDVVLQVIERDPLTVRQLQPNTPLDLETICLKAMSKEPARRYASCAELEADLRRYLRNEPIIARPISRLERSVRWCRRNPKIAAPIATTIVAVLAAMSISIWSAVTLTKKNADIVVQKDKAVKAQGLAEKNEQLARKNEKLAYDRAVDAKNAVFTMLTTIRNDIPPTEEKLKSVRERLLRITSDQLDRLPDAADDGKLTTGLEKARILETQAITATELGEHSKAVEYLTAALQILSQRNDAQANDRTRVNLTTVLSRLSEARGSAQRDMEVVYRHGKDCLVILEDVLKNPKPTIFDATNGSVPRFETIQNLIIFAYRHALTLYRLGRIQEGLDVLDHALSHIDEMMKGVRKEYFSNLNDEDWTRQEQGILAQLADQWQLRAVLLASAGRDDEVAAAQQKILDNARYFVTVDGSGGKIDSSGKLSAALTSAGTLARQRGQLDEALGMYEEAAGITRAMYNDNSALDERRNRHHVSLMRLAGLLRSRDLPRARELYAEARRIADDMVKADDKSPTAKIALALVSPFSGPPQAAVDLADEILKNTVPCDAEMAIDVARVFASAAEAESLEATPDFDAVERWKKTALSLIGDAIASGYRNGVYLTGEPDLTAIRSMPEFDELLEKCRKVK